MGWDGIKCGGVKDARALYEKDRAAYYGGGPVKKKIVGKETWYVWTSPRTGAFIEVVIFERKTECNRNTGAKETWVYSKDMPETMHPYYYGCPIEWLDEVPCPESKDAQAWRAKMRAKVAPKVTEGQRIEVGDVVIETTLMR